MDIIESLTQMSDDYNRYLKERQARIAAKLRDMATEVENVKSYADDPSMITAGILSTVTNGLNNLGLDALAADAGRATMARNELDQAIAGKNRSGQN